MSIFCSTSEIVLLCLFSCCPCPVLVSSFLKKKKKKRLVILVGFGEKVNLDEYVESTIWNSCQNTVFRSSYTSKISQLLILINVTILDWASLVAQVVKNLFATQETRVRFLGQEDLLEKGRATHSNILAWKIPWKEEPGGLESMGSQ